MLVCGEGFHRREPARRSRHRLPPDEPGEDRRRDERGADDHQHDHREQLVVEHADGLADEGEDQAYLAALA